MNIEELKKLLEESKITQEQFDSMSSLIPKNEEEKENSDSDEDKENADIEKIIQRAVDRATNKLGNEKKKLQGQLDKLKKEKLSDEELKQLELAEKEQLIAEREKALQDKENRLYAVKALKKAGLDDGGEDSLELIDFILGEDESDIDNKVKAFKALIDRKVKNEVEKTFKEKGREPVKGSNFQDEKNPYKKETFNLTEQFEIERNNPELAKSLKAAAGIL